MENIKLHLRDIHPQMKNFIMNNMYPCHIRDGNSCYIVINDAMKDLLNLPEHYDISGKHISEIPHNGSNFAQEICQYDKQVIDSAKNLPVLKTLAYGRKGYTQPYVFDIYPYYKDNGRILGTIALAKPFQYFSIARYIARQLPVSPKFNAIMPYTEREQEIIFLIYHGWTSKEAVRELGISHRTVENRICNMYQKAHVHNLNEFRDHCYELGIVNKIPERLLIPSVQALV